MNRAGDVFWSDPGTWVTLVSGPHPGLYAFFVSRDGDPVPNENGVITVTGPGAYAWVNNRGTTGTLTDAPGGDKVSTVTSGSNEGTVRVWKSQ